MQTDDAGLWNWEWLGPGNIGGRIRAILIHPTSTSTIWIGGVAGGIYKSTNGGASPGGDGTQANPYQTIREAFDVAGYGSTIHIESGTYDEAPPSLYATKDLGLIIITNGSVLIK